jgi:cytochrome c oxidase subunit 1
MGTVLKEWIFTTDHKRVGVLYLIGTLAAFALAGVMAMLMRAELTTVGPTITSNPNDYNVWLYFHGAAMILGFQIPALTGFLANYCVPLMIGAKDVAFPRLNALSVWLFWGGIVVALLTFAIPDPPDVMWTGYPPYSLKTGGNTAFYTFAVLLIGFSSILGGVNFLTTITFMRAPGMGWNKLNVFVWSTFFAFIIQLIFVPVLGTAVIMLLFDKYLGTHFFDPAAGGDVLIYQNLFWFYSHPAVYVILLPFVGIVYDIFATFARQRVFNYKMVVYGGMGGVLLLAGQVWVHHLYYAGMPDWLRAGMTVSTLLISIPVGLLMIGLIGTLYRGAISFQTPMLYALGVLFTFFVGGLTGIPLAMASLTFHVGDTYFIPGHFHYVMAVAGTYAIFGSVYYLYPKMTGKMYSEGAGKLGFWLSFIGINIVFTPMMIAGFLGMPRRYYDYAQFPQLEPLHQLMTVGAVIILLGAVVTLYNWIHGLVKGEKAPANPWGSKSLEWTTASPPPHGNWPAPPSVGAEWTPYEYGKKPSVAPV